MSYFKGIRDHKFESGLFDKNFIWLHICGSPFVADLSEGQEAPPQSEVLQFFQWQRILLSKAIDSHLEKRNAWGLGECQCISHKNRCLRLQFLWLGQVLAMTGIDPEGFKAHSTRSASPPKAEVTRVSLTDIIKQDNCPRFQLFKFFTEKLSRNMIPIFNQESSTRRFDDRSLEWWLLALRIKCAPQYLIGKLKFRIMCGALRDLVLFVQVKNCEKHTWRSVSFSKVSGFSLQLY